MRTGKKIVLIVGIIVIAFLLFSIINNYSHPTHKDSLNIIVADNMRIAFEDQIVQKIMPKLRGIETRGKGGERLVRRISVPGLSEGQDLPVGLSGLCQEIHEFICLF